MAGEDSDDFQQFLYRFEDYVLNLAQYTRDEALIRSE